MGDRALCHGGAVSVVQLCSFLVYSYLLRGGQGGKSKPSLKPGKVDEKLPYSSLLPNKEAGEK